MTFNDSAFESMGQISISLRTSVILVLIYFLVLVLVFQLLFRFRFVLVFFRYKHNVDLFIGRFSVMCINFTSQDDLTAPNGQL